MNTPLSLDAARESSPYYDLMTYVSVIDTQPEERSKFCVRILDKDNIHNSITNPNSTINEFEDSDSNLMENVIISSRSEEYQSGPQLVEQDLKTLDIIHLLSDHLSIISSLARGCQKM